MPLITLPNVTIADPAAKYLSPVPDVAGIFILGSGEDSSANRVVRSRDGIVIGSPDKQSGFDTMTSRVSYIDTGIVPQGGFSAYIVARFTEGLSVSSHRGALFGNYGVGSVGVFQNSLTSIRAQTYNGTSWVDTDLPNVAPDVFALYTARFGGSGGVTTVRNETTAAQSASAARSFVARPVPVRLGSYVNSLDGKTDVMAAAFLHRVPSSEDHERMVEWLRGLAASRGISV